MKKLTFLLLGLIAFAFTSCSDDDPSINVYPGEKITTLPVLEALPAPAQYVVQENVNEATVAGTFKWAPAVLEYDGAVAYYIQIAPAGSDFSNAVNVFSESVSTTSKSFTFGDLNSALTRLNATLIANGKKSLGFGTLAEVDVRVKAIAAKSQAIGYSLTQLMKINAYEKIVIELPLLWIPGGYQAASGYGSDWKPEVGPTLAASAPGKTDFEGYVYFAGASEFLLTPASNFDNKYSKGATAGTLLYNGSDNLAIDAPGYYKIKADTDPAKLTYSTTKLTWGVVGNATPGGWDADTPMTYNPTTKKWTVTVALTTQSAPDNGMKFRANNDWGFNFGDTGADGKLEDGGTNIGTVAGTYLITLDLSNPRNYTYTMVKQ